MVLQQALVEAEDDSLPGAGIEIGIDLGLRHFAVLSDGRKVASPGFLRRAERKLRKAQRALSRLRTEPLREIDEWLAPYRAAWAGRLDALEAHLDDMED